MLSRFRGALIYTAVCVVVLLLFRARAWEHVASLNGDEWQPIQNYIRANRQSDEPICFLPRWTFGHATDQYKFRGIDVLRAPEDAWEGRDAPYAGFWVVSQFGAFDESSVPRDRYPHRGRVRLGGAELFLFRQEPFTLPSSLVLRLDEAHCFLQETDRGRLELVWSRDGFIIPWGHPNRENLSYLGCRPVEERFGGRAKLGIWFHPPGPGSSMSIVWNEIELQPWLAVSGGLRDQVANRRSPPTSLSVVLDGRTIKTLSFPSQRGWRTFAVKLGPAAARPGATGRLGFRVSAKNNHSRHFIFDAQFEATQPEETEAQPRRPSRPAVSRPARGPVSRPVRATSSGQSEDEGDDNDGGGDSERQERDSPDEGESSSQRDSGTPGGKGTKDGH